MNDDEQTIREPRIEVKTRGTSEMQQEAKVERKDSKENKRWKGKVKEGRIRIIQNSRSD
jgi:hypothetical protein